MRQSVAKHDLFPVELVECDDNCKPQRDDNDEEIVRDEYSSAGELPSALPVRSQVSIDQQILFEKKSD